MEGVSHDFSRRGAAQICTTLHDVASNSKLSRVSGGEKSAVAEGVGEAVDVWGFVASTSSMETI